MSTQFSHPTHPETIRALGLRKTSRDHFWIGSASEFIDFAEQAPMTEYRDECTRSNEWGGAVDFDDAIRFGREGNLEAVEQSEPLLAELEEMFPVPTARRAVADDVSGGFPNVPAFIAGTPLTMRRRVKRESEFAPLAITVDLMCSSGVSVENVRKRGVAILALVRALSARRPVELYCGISCSGAHRSDSAHTYFKIDSAPLDLARAAYFLAHPVVLRCLGFIHTTQHFGTDRSIPWPYGCYGRCRPFLKHSLRMALPHIDDVLCIPGMEMHDKAANRPVEWVAEHVKAYGGADLADDYQVAA